MSLGCLPGTACRARPSTNQGEGVDDAGAGAGGVKPGGQLIFTCAFEPAPQLVVVAAPMVALAVLSEELPPQADKSARGSKTVAQHAAILSLGFCIALLRKIAGSP